MLNISKFTFGFSFVVWCCFFFTFLSYTSTPVSRFCFIDQPWSSSSICASSLLLLLHASIWCCFVFFQPNIDSETGVLDRWPAHATKPPLMPLSSTGRERNAAPKPKFLDKLEKFLVKELRALECTGSNTPSETRLQVIVKQIQPLATWFKKMNVI